MEMRGCLHLLWMMWSLRDSKRIWSSHGGIQKRPMWSTGMPWRSLPPRWFPHCLPHCLHLPSPRGLSRSINTDIHSLVVFTPPPLPPRWFPHCLPHCLHLPPPGFFLAVCTYTFRVDNCRSYNGSEDPVRLFFGSMMYAYFQHCLSIVDIIAL